MGNARKITALFFLALLSAALFGAAPAAAQSGVLISPTIISETAKARDIFNYEINIENRTDRKVELYAVVSDMQADMGAAIATTAPDRSVSLSKWIKIMHGVIELMPGESTVEKLEINVSPYALPGRRYATIALVNAPNRYAAANKAGNNSFGQIFLNFNIEENIVEKAQITGFKSGRDIYFKPAIAFELILSNFGNRDIFPAGRIYISDRRGQIAAEIAVDQGLEPVAAGQESALAFVWNEPKAIGKYKARLELRYGQSGQELTDTVYFWYLPWLVLAAFLAFMLILAAVLTVILFRKSFGPGQPAALDPSVRQAGVINLRSGRK